MSNEQTICSDCAKPYSECGGHISSSPPDRVNLKTTPGPWYVADQ